MHDQLPATEFDNPHWYALFVRSHQEKRVALFLDRLDVVHFLPCYRSVRQWKDRRVTLDMPLFPGYLFVHVPLKERMRVQTVPQVVSLVGTKDSPAVISDEEIAAIRAAVEHGRAEPHEYLEAGQRVVITEGVMLGMEGILMTVRNRARVVVSLQSIGRAFVVEVGANCVRPLAERRKYSALPRATSLHERVKSSELPQMAFVS
jgi:transcription antitermination factor NusG